MSDLSKHSRSFVGRPVRVPRPRQPHQRARGGRRGRVAGAGPRRQGAPLDARPPGAHDPLPGRGMGLRDDARKRQGALEKVVDQDPQGRQGVGAKDRQGAGSGYPCRVRVDVFDLDVLFKNITLVDFQT